MAHEPAQHADQQFPDNTESGKHILIALVVASVIVFGARQLTDYLVRPAAPAVTARPAAAPTTADISAQDEQIAADARKARQAREQALMEEDRVLREKKKAEAMRARDEAVAASQAEDARREAAWQRFYTRPKKCDVAAPDDATRVDCSNQYIRAKERFDKLYADGKLH
ncbi:hypothetical protein VVD49_15230 [Uliginosibacterium sp. H3]|uniref:Uncharacterized protein n=1 Tax=Uliginosibacterium silvisoli TaxID=3114758 RepID=A0ABU6K754_9RHOO|nr:hypothetical protein [Uliginosibacterium sp. H3]